MKKIKRITVITISALLLITVCSCHKYSGGYNPYLHKKVKPSGAELGRQTKADRKARKAYRRQERKTSMHFYGHKPGPKK